MSDVRDTQWLRDTMFACVRVFFPEDDFDETLKITWIPAAARRQFNYGLFYRQEKLIQINPVLAWDWVPAIVPTGIIYHELVHAKLTDEHDAHFNAVLKHYPYDRDMEVWCHQNEEKLIATKPPLWKDRR
jgi:hypothetical protein